MTKYMDLTETEKIKKRQQSKIRTDRWKANNPETYKLKGRIQHLKRRYGITLEYYDEMYQSQEGRCAICNTWQATLDVDHEKLSGNIRGLLCHRCNWAVGILGDDIKILKSAVLYFARNAEKWNKR